MKRIILSTILAIFAFAFQCSLLTAQTVVFGTATAEIVEVVSISSSTVNDFNIPKDNNEIENLSLGKININSGKDVECNIIIKSDQVSNENAVKIIVETDINHKSKIHSVSGNRTLSLTGTALHNKEMGTGLFKASYSIILAYN